MKTFITVWFLITAPIVAAQNPYEPGNVRAFADYLWTQGDYARAAGEYQRLYFLDSARSAEYALFQTARCWWRLSQPEKALPYLYSISTEPSSAFGDSVQILAALCHIKINSAIDKINLSAAYCRDGMILEAMSSLNQNDWRRADSVLQYAQCSEEGDTRIQSLKKNIQAFRSHAHRSPVLGGLFSAVIPGSGKLYAGRTTDGLYSMALISGCSYLAYEGFNKKGKKSLQGWLFGSAALFFHVGNIYGSVQAVRLHNRDIYEASHRDIERHIALWFNF